MMMEINQSKNYTWKVINVVMHCDTHADITSRRRHTHKKKYIYIHNNSHINCGSDKYKQFNNDQFGSFTITPIGILYGDHTG